MNQFPTTAKQLALYQEFHRNGVKYILIGALAARFYGRNRVTKDIDLLVESSIENCVKVKQSLLNLGYPAAYITATDFLDFEIIRVGGKMLVDLHISYLGIRYEDVQTTLFEYEGVNIVVAAKQSLIQLMQANKVCAEDVRVLKLLDDPIANAVELNLSQ